MAIHKQLSRTRIGVQSAIGTVASTFKDLVLLGDANPLGQSKRETAPNRSQRRRRRDYVDPIQLQKSGSPVEFAVNLQRMATALTSSATPVAYSNSSALSHQLLYRMIFGGELTPAAGSAVVSSSGSPVDTVNVTSGHGGRFVIGQVIWIAGVGVRRVTGISTDALTISPPASAISDGAVVRNLYQYFPAETDSTVFSLQHAFVESGSAITQMQALGVHGSGEFKLDINAAGEISFKGMGLDWSGPDDLSISDDPVADDMGAPMLWQPTLYWEAFSGAPTVAELSSVKLSVPRKWQKVPGAVIQGVGSVHEVAAREDPITLEIEGLMSTTAWTDFAAGNAKSFAAYTEDGSGSALRTSGFWVPRAKVIETPQVTFMDQLVAFKAKLRADMAQDIAGATPALSTAEIRTTNLIWFNG
jgi:hypothetical protein